MIRPTPLDQRLIAVHTHLVVKAGIDQRAASERVRQAFDTARAAGIPRRVMRRAVQMLEPGQRRLNEQAAALLQAAEAGVAGAGLRPGALSEHDPSRNVTAQPESADDTRA